MSMQKVLSTLVLILLLSVNAGADVFPPDDGDEDGVPNARDNCLEAGNPSQRDTDNDGFGNACDMDLNNDGIVNAVDLGILRTVFFTNDPDADSNGDGVVNVIDLGVMRTSFFEPPGPTSFVTFTGAVSSDWFDASNWRPQRVPGSFDHVLIPADAERDLEIFSNVPLPNFVVTVGTATMQINRATALFSVAMRTRFGHAIGPDTVVTSESSEFDAPAEDVPLPMMMVETSELVFMDYESTYLNVAGPGTVRLQPNAEMSVMHLSLDGSHLVAGPGTYVVVYDSLNLIDAEFTMAGALPDSDGPTDVLFNIGTFQPFIIENSTLRFIGQTISPSRLTVTSGSRTWEDSLSVEVFGNARISAPGNLATLTLGSDISIDGGDLSISAANVVLDGVVNCADGGFRIASASTNLTVTPDAELSFGNCSVQFPPED